MRALSRNTRRVTALTLAAALVIAVYLNWQYARTDTGIAADEEAQVVSAEPVQSDTVLDGLPTEAETVSAANKNYGEAQLVSVASDSGAGGADPGRRAQQEQCDGPEHHGGGSKIKSVSLRPEGIGLEKEPVVWSDRVFQTSIEINPALMV